MVVKAPRRHRERGQRIDDAIPDEGGHRSVRSPYPSWPTSDKPVSDYWHRLLLETPDGRPKCDCGKVFGRIVDFERHQHAYRHPTPVHAR